MTTDPVVTVSGGEVRWFTSLAAAAHPGSAPLVATAAGVVVRGYLTDLPAGWVDAAVRAHETLSADPGADLSMMATHRNSGPPNGPLVPADRASER